MNIGAQLFSAMILTLALGGCAGTLLQSKEPQSTIYSLRSTESKAEPSSIPARIVEIALPFVPPGMDRNRIALYLNNGQKLDYYAAALWSSDLEELVQDFTRRTASTTLPYVVAVMPEQGIDANYKLQTRVNEFQPVYEGDFGATPVLKVSVEFTLLELPTEQILSSFTLYKQEAANGNTLDEIILGLEKILQDVERDAFAKMDSKLNPQQNLSEKR